MQNYGLGFEELKTVDELNEPELVPIAAESPVELSFDEQGRLESVLYCDQDGREQNQPFNMWSETILRDDDGKVIGVKTLRPSGSTVIEQFIFDDNGRFIGSKLIRESLTPSPDPGGGDEGEEEEEEEEEE